MSGRRRGPELHVGDRVPLRLRDVGVAKESLMEIVDHAMDDWSITRMPRRPSRDEPTGLLAQAW